ncbi:MAG: CPBP family intramembrane metalloprotease [Clostridia bacterium]|nr:CPBP family intramembrane metalloprotease [Clostridia bacterium]
MDMFPETYMLHEAKQARTRVLRPVVTVLIAVLLFVIASTVEGMILGTCTAVWIFTDDAVTEKISAAGGILADGDLNAYIENITETINDAMAHQPIWLILVQLFLTAAVIVTVLIYALKIEKRSAASLGLHRRGLIPEYAAGLLIGAVIFSGAVGICALSGSITLTPAESVNVPLLLAFFVGFLVQGFSEELLCRGLLMVSLSRGNPVWACVTVNSLFFAILHLGNPGISLLAFLNLALFGVFASLYTLRRGSLWGIAALHSVWNFVQGNLWGISVSGMSAMPSVFRTALGTEKADVLFNGGAFGLEGGIGVTIVLVLGIGVLLFMPTKRSEIAPAKPETSEADMPAGGL